jgi:hypothetical protein
MALDKFINDPQLIAERAAKGLDLYRNFAGERIRILSLGEPQMKESWSDDVGRVWQTSTWNVPSADMTFALNCSPVPVGTFCEFAFYPTGVFEQNIMKLERKSFNQFVFSYGGTFSQWEEFFKLDEKFLPEYMRKGEVHVGKNEMSLKLGEKSMVYKDALNENANLGMKLRYSPLKGSKLEIADFVLQPNKDNKVFFSKKWLWKPLSSATEKVQKFWAAAEKKSGHFNGKEFKAKEWFEVLITSKKTTVQGIDNYPYSYCSRMVDEKMENLPERCAAFAKLNSH